MSQKLRRIHGQNSDFLKIRLSSKQRYVSARFTHRMEIRVSTLAGKTGKMPVFKNLSGKTGK